MPEKKIDQAETEDTNTQSAINFNKLKDSIEIEVVLESLVKKANRQVLTEIYRAALNKNASLS